MNIPLSKLIGVISDTHDQVEYLKKSIQFLNSVNVDFVVHCGDWISPFTLRHYAELKSPIYGVFGNNDGDKFRHLKNLERHGISATMEDQFLEIKRYDRRMAVYHGDTPAIVKALVKCGDYDIVFHGHDHIAKIEVGENGVVSFNPGTLMRCTNPQIQGASIGLYDAKKHDGQIVWLDEI